MADYNRYGHTYASGYTSHAPPPSYGYGGYPSAYPPPPSQGTPGGFGGYGFVPVAFPPGTHPDVERAFRAADRDCSGAIDEHELQGALSTAYHRFSIRTVRLLIFLFNDPAASSPSRMGTSMTPTIPQSILLLSFHASTGRIGLGIQIPKIRIQIDTHCSK